MVAALCGSAATAWAVISNDTVSGAADLRLQLVATGTLDANATNDYQLPAASPCFAGIGQTASTAPGRDAVYRFVAPTSGSYAFRGRVAGANLVLYVAGALPAGGSGAQTVTDCLGAANRSSLIASSGEEVSPIALAAGQEVFVVADQQSVASGTQLQVTAERLATGETEGNNTPGTATALPACGARGSIGTPGDVDFYSLGTPSAGDRLFAIVDGLAGNSPDFDLRVTTSTATLEYDDMDTDAQFGGFAPVIAGTPLSAVQTYLRVSELTGSPTEPYRLFYAVQPSTATPTGEVEPNATTAEATSTPINYAGGGLSSGTDVDTFAFTAPARTPVFVALDSDPVRINTPSNLALTILDANGAVVESVNDSGSTSSTTASPGTLTGATPFSPAEGLIFRAPAAGTYYARVSTTVGSAGGYLLSIAPSCRVGTTPQLNLQPTSLPAATVGTPYAQTLSSAFGSAPFLFERDSGALPPGLTIATDGSISGTPTAGGDFTFGAFAFSNDGLTGGRQYSITVAKQKPQLATSASASVQIGGSVSDIATISGGSDPNGTVDFALYGPDDGTCSKTPVHTSSQTVTGAGNYGSGDFKPSAPGLYRWIAAYSGDAANDAAAGHCNDTGESVLVTAAPQTQPDPEATPDSKAPETTITKKSDAKTTKRKVKFKFEADESATFECKLDKADFEPCTSPEKTKKLDFGKHKFQVRATDAAGNVDQTPAKDKFKVKKKR